jgi:hypothetical protein
VGIFLPQKQVLIKNKRRGKEEVSIAELSISLS